MRKAVPPEGGRSPVTGPDKGGGTVAGIGMQARETGCRLPDRAKVSGTDCFVRQKQGMDRRRGFVKGGAVV